MTQPKGEALKVGFNVSLRLEFHGSRVTANAGFLWSTMLVRGFIQSV